MRLVKFEDTRTGWLGESCWTADGRRFIKRLEHRHNRRHGRKICRDFKTDSTNVDVTSIDASEVLP